MILFTQTGNTVRQAKYYSASPQVLVHIPIYRGAPVRDARDIISLIVLCD